MGANLFAGFVRRLPSRPEAKASGPPIPKPREWGSDYEAFCQVGEACLVPSPEPE